MKKQQKTANKNNKKQEEMIKMMDEKVSEMMNTKNSTVDENKNENSEETIEMLDEKVNEMMNVENSTIDENTFEIEDINFDGDGENVIESTENETVETVDEKAETETENSTVDENKNENSEETIKMLDEKVNEMMNVENSTVEAAGTVNKNNEETIEMMNETVNETSAANETKTVESTATTFMVGGYQVSGLTQEQLEAALKAAGIATEIKPVKTTTKVVDKLQHDGDFAIDKTGERFDFASLTEEQKVESMKSGLSPKNLAILTQAAEIKKISGYRTRQVNSDQPATEKPGYQIREIVKSNLEMISSDESLLNNLQDKEFCKMNFKLSYPMFLDITGMDAVQIRSARKDNKGHDRYAPAIYEMNNRQYLLTNDLYAKNLPLVKKFFHVG